jgi:hypothetical protein
VHFHFARLENRPVRSAYQPPASSTFSQNHQQPVSSNFLLEQTSTSHQPNEQTVPSLAVGGKRTGCSKQYVEVDPKTTTFITQIRKIDRDSVNEWEACDLHP